MFIIQPLTRLADCLDTAWDELLGGICCEHLWRIAIGAACNLLLLALTLGHFPTDPDAADPAAPVDEP